MSRSDSYYAEQGDLRQVIVGKCYAIQAGVRIAARDPHFNLKGLFEDLHWCEDTYHYFTVMAVGSDLTMFREEVKGHLDRARAALTGGDATGDRDAPSETQQPPSPRWSDVPAEGDTFRYQGIEVAITKVTETEYTFATTNPMDDWQKWTLPLPNQTSSQTIDQQKGK